MKNRIISLVLALSLCASLLVLPARAYDYQPDAGAFGDLAAVLDSWMATFFDSMLPDFLGINPSPLDFMDSFAFPDGLTGEVTHEQLEQARDYWNSAWNRWWRTAVAPHLESPFHRVNATITSIPSQGIERLCDNETGAMIVDSRGRDPYTVTR